MASSPLAVSPATPDQASPELLAPPGWQKKVAPVKKGGTPTRKDVFFVAPDGEELKSKRMLEHYLKSHPGSPALTEFDWNTGETPRRSSRLSSKSRPSIDSPEGGSGGKRPKKNVVEKEAPQNEEGAKPEKPPTDVLPNPDEEQGAMSTLPKKNFVEEEVPQNEEGAKREGPPTEVLPNPAEQDEMMEDVEKLEAVKPSEETIMASVEEKTDEKEAEGVEGQTDKATEATSEMIQESTQEDEEKKSNSQTLVEEKSGGELCDGGVFDTDVREVKEDGKNQVNPEDGFPVEPKEQNAFSDKPSSGFQQFPEAPARPVGVTI